jgi:hypothetical protein
MDNGNHPVSRIAETKIWNMVAHAARLFAISTRRQHDDRDVSIGCGKFVAVEVDKANRIGFAGRRRATRSHGGEEERRRQ